MACQTALLASSFSLLPSQSQSQSQSQSCRSSLSRCCIRIGSSFASLNSSPFQQPAAISTLSLHSPSTQLFCKAAAAATDYVFPDPIPEFAETETDKFRSHLLQKLAKKDIFGESLDEVACICTEIFSNFLHTEYGGPGTLLVIPFIDMADTINERGLPGGPQAARAAVVWAQKHVDKDWNEWTGGNN